MSSIGFFDIETTGLNPRQHRFLTTAVLRNLDSDPLLVVNLDNAERAALLTTRTWLYDLDRVVSWGGNYFDIPFINYRLLANGEDKMQLVEHFDMKAWCKRVDPFGLMASADRYNHGIEAHAKHVGIPTKDTPFDKELWDRASNGDVDALISVATHNVEDVHTLRNLYDKLIEPVDERKRQLSLF